MAEQEGDLVLCTVNNVEGTTVFVTLENGKTGTIVFSEVAPGRIRNIRDYAMPNKKIVCKILRISSNNIDLSLRRVTSKERGEVMEQFKQEQTAKAVLKSLFKEKSQETQEKILSNFPNLSDFFNKAREDESLIKKYIPAEFIEQIKKVIQKRKKEVEVKKIVKLKSLQPDGMKKIRALFADAPAEIEITYLAAGTFQLKIKAEDYKKANTQMLDFTQKIEAKAKKNFEEFSIEEK
jgi:translation initiation factor 2 alpha subunit (eIF-2alpha)